MTIHRVDAALLRGDLHVLDLAWEVPEVLAECIAAARITPGTDRLPEDADPVWLEWHRAVPGHHKDWQPASGDWGSAWRLFVRTPFWILKAMAWGWMLNTCARNAVQKVDGYCIDGVRALEYAVATCLPVPDLSQFFDAWMVLEHCCILLGGHLCAGDARLTDSERWRVGIWLLSTLTDPKATFPNRDPGALVERLQPHLDRIAPTRMPPIPSGSRVTLLHPALVCAYTHAPRLLWALAGAEHFGNVHQPQLQGCPPAIARPLKAIAWGNDQDVPTLLRLAVRSDRVDAPFQTAGWLARWACEMGGLLYMDGDVLVAHSILDAMQGGWSQWTASTGFVSSAGLAEFRRLGYGKLPNKQALIDMVREALDAPGAATDVDCIRLAVAIWSGLDGPRRDRALELALRDLEARGRTTGPAILAATIEPRLDPSDQPRYERLLQALMAWDPPTPRVDQERAFLIARNSQRLPPGDQAPYVRWCEEHPLPEPDWEGATALDRERYTDWRREMKRLGARQPPRPGEGAHD